MTLPEIRSLILYSFNRNNEIDLFVSGMNYTVMVDDTGKGLDVELKDKTGNQFDPARKYNVGMNSYIGASYKFDHADPGEARPETTAQTLIDFLKVVKTVDYEGVKRVEVRKKGE
jgi:2',3'-cyclic-nucleotide 2'-phosphodiesterase (5'-nucleotidase family)